MKISLRQLKEAVRRITEAYGSSYAQDLQDHVDYMYETNAIGAALEVWHDDGSDSEGNGVVTIEDTAGLSAGEFYSQEEFASGLSHEEVEGSFLHPDCEKAYLKARNEYPGAGLQVINYARLNDENLWGKGIGKLAYQQLIHDAGADGKLIVPHWCAHGGTTSNQARRLWEKLRRGYQTAGPILIPNNLNI